MRTDASGRAVFDDAPEMTMRDYWRVIVRRKWLIALAVLVTLGGAMFMVSQQKKIYEADAQMLVRALPGDTVFSSQQQSTANAARNIETEIRVLEGSIVEDRVRLNLGLEEELPNVKGSAVGQTDVVSVRVQSHDPAVAAVLANAYVQAYIDTRRERNVNSLLDAAAEVQTKVTELQQQINELDQLVEDAPDDEKDELEASLAPQRQLLVDQQAIFKQRLDQIQVDASLQSGSAQLVRPAESPDEPVEPSPLRTAALALIVGLLLRLGAAFLADYLDDSVTSPEELERATGGLPVLTAVPDEPPPDHRPVSLSSPNDQAVEAYRGGMDRNVARNPVPRCGTPVVRLTGAL